MDTKEIIERFKVDLATAKAKGKTEISVDALESYLDALGSQATSSFEFLRLEQVGTIAHYEATTAQAREMFKSVISAGKDAINAAIIINGGAAIAILAFLGNAVGTPSGSAMVGGVANVILYFGVGVFLGGLGFGARYISQFLYAVEKYRNIGHIFNGIAWLVILSSLLLFVCGVISAAWEIRSVQSGTGALNALINVLA